MSIAFLYPYALWLLLLFPLMVGLALAGPRRPTLGRFWFGLVLRAALMLAMILALAGIQVRLPSDLLSVVFVLDVSESVPAEQRSQGEAFIQQAIREMPDGNRAAIVVFGADALVERLASEDRQTTPFASVPVTVGTDIENSLQLGLALFPDEGARRLVLLTDGRENIGQAITQAELAAAQSVELTYVPLGGPEGDFEVLVEALDAPADARQGQEFDLRVTVNSSDATDATLRVFGDGDLLRTEEVSLNAGQNRFLIPVEAGEAGFRRYRAQIVPDNDTRLQNNEAGAFTVVYGPPSILIVEGTAEEGENMARALESTGMAVTRITPSALPVTLPELAAYDSIVLANVPSDELPAGLMEVLQVYVRDLGRGLVMLGGENSFGAGGYLRSPLEAALPVDMDVRTTEQTPNTAVVLAVDKSGSMGRCHCDDPDLNQSYDRLEAGQPKVDIAKAAILSASSALGAQDFLGVVAFDDSPKWAVDVQKLIDAVTLERSVGAIRAEGQTNLEAGVAEAYQSLEGVEARVKHVILLTDGWVRGGDLIALAREMKDQGITLSVVAAGEGSAEYLTELASVGGGRFYPAEDILKVPEFFLKETVQAVGRYIVETPFYPLPAEAGHPILRGLDAAGLPALFGYNGATPKATARISLTTPAGDPLLATWQYGLGRSAAWTSDLKGQWAIDWLGWDGYSRFVSQMVNWTLPAPQVEGLRARVSYVEGKAQITAEATGEDGLPRNFLDVRATLIAPDLENIPVALQQVGPGRYAAEVQLTGTGAYLAQINVSEDGQALGQQVLGLVAPYSAEYRSGGIDLAFLRELAARTGGDALSEPLAAFVHNLPAADLAREIWAPLLLAVVILFPLDIAVRRVMLGAADFRKAREWLVTRLPQRRRESGERPRVLGELFDARERVRRRQSRTGSPQEKVKPAPLRSEKTPAKQAPDQEQSPGREAEPPVETPDESGQADTLSRLRSAKERRRRNKDR